MMEVREGNAACIKKRFIPWKTLALYWKFFLKHTHKKETVISAELVPTSALTSITPGTPDSPRVQVLPAPANGLAWLWTKQLQPRSTESQQEESKAGSVQWTPPQSTPTCSHAQRQKHTHVHRDTHTQRYTCTHSCSSHSSHTHTKTYTRTQRYTWTHTRLRKGALFLTSLFTPRNATTLGSRGWSHSASSLPFISFPPHSSSHLRLPSLKGVFPLEHKIQILIPLCIFLAGWPKTNDQTSQPRSPQWRLLNRLITRVPLLIFPIFKCSLVQS